MLAGLPKIITTLVLVSVTVVAFLAFVSMQMRASRRDRTPGNPRRQAAIVVAALVLLGLVIVAISFDFGWLILGAALFIGGSVTVLYVLPRQRARRRYM